MKAHGFQGCEAEKVCVVQMRDKTGSWDLCGRADYLFSALTRAKNEMLLLVVDPQKEIKDVSDTLNITA